jgi:hypothetical protein
LRVQRGEQTYRQSSEPGVCHNGRALDADGPFGAALDSSPTPESKYADTEIDEKQIPRHGRRAHSLASLSQRSGLSDPPERPKRAASRRKVGQGRPQARDRGKRHGRPREEPANMKLSELIAALQDQLEKRGDVDVGATYEGRLANVSSVYFTRFNGWGEVLIDIDGGMYRDAFEADAERRWSEVGL